MADAHTARLCVQIIHSNFGPLTAAVASALLIRGRLGLSQVIRFTGLKPRTVRASIIVLTQHNLLWHAQTEDEGEGFEVNVEECLVRLRFGRFVWQTEQVFGQSGAEIVQIILDHGKLRPPDILSRLQAREQKDATLYSRTLLKLVSTNYLKPSTILSHISPRDKCIQYEAEERAKISGFPTAKELRAAKEVASARLAREEAEAEAKGLTRKSKGKQRSDKTGMGEDVVDNSIYLRVNYDRYNVQIQHGLIEKAARERFNEGAALVIRALLNEVEAGHKSVAETRSESVSIANVVVRLADEERLKDGLVLSSKKASNAAYVKDYLGMLAAADNPTPAGRASSFASLAASKVSVEYDIISRRLRRRVVESVAQEKHGPEGVRILRLLLDTGKLDEKQISKTVMMAPKDVRRLLAALAADSLISTQEVPRTADRNPTRTFYLWHVDLAKTFSVILGGLHKTLYNIGMRRQAEKEVPEVKAVLEKRERSDVRQDEGLLSRMERDILREWEKKEEKLTVLEMRVEETVFIVKDLSSGGIEDD